MKRVLIGGFLMLIGTIWGLAVCVFCGMNLTNAWPTPPGRFLTTVSETGMTLPFVLAIVFIVLGFAIFVKEYFTKDEQ